MKVTRQARGARGLSPRVRGKLQYKSGGDPKGGSIPACAGEAGGVKESCCLREVYPRVCGGSDAAAKILLPSGGLSPRVRGKPPSAAPIPTMRRSIPACAGEAPSTTPPSRNRKVYPRVCGGSGGEGYGKPSALGLSPRVRGKRPFLLYR